MGSQGPRRPPPPTQPECPGTPFSESPRGEECWGRVRVGELGTQVPGLLPSCVTMDQPPALLSLGPLP